MVEETRRKENPKLGSLQGQMKDMSNDFEDMIRAKEEAKKQLEAKFQDVYRYYYIYIYIYIYSI